MNSINTQYTEIEENWIRTISIYDIDFVDTDLLTSAIWDAKDFLIWKIKYEKFDFDWKREFYRFLWNYFIVKYSDKELRDNDKKVLSKEWKFNKFWKTEKDENWFQIPKTDFVVDFEWNYYMLAQWTLLLDEDLTDLDKWVFKSMVIDFDKFNWIWSEAEEQVKKVESDVDWLLNG